MILPLREANLLRKRIRAILALCDSFYKGRGGETIHDLRVASRRLRELFDYLSSSLPENWLNRSRRQAAKITKALGQIREIEANFQILRQWHREKKHLTAALELMIQSQREIRNIRRSEARNQISRKRFQRFEKMLLQIKGSRNFHSLPSASVNTRIAEFVSFDWTPAVDDQSLHELRIHTKKLRYALEIFNTLHSKSDLDFPIEAIRELQEVLGQIHDLAILELAVEQEQEQWDPIRFEIIPAALAKLREEIGAEKRRLYSSVLPFYSRAVDSLRMHFRSIATQTASKVQAG